MKIIITPGACRRLCLALCLSIPAIFSTVSAKDAAPARWSARNAAGTNVSVKNSYATYAVPEGYPYSRFDAPEFNVRVNGKAWCGLYEDLNHKAQQMVFGQFSFSEGKRQRVEVICKEPFDTFRILPANVDIADCVRTGPSSLSFTIDRPKQNITFVFDEKFQDRAVLHLFCNPIEKPHKDATHYFGPGYHNLRDGGATGNLTITGDKTVYIAPGAVVDGSITCHRLTTGGVSGQGILVNSDSRFRSINNSECHGGRIENIIVHSRCNSWQVVYHRCDGMTVDGIRVVSAFYRSNDGFDLTGCSNLTFKDCFIRAADDCVAIETAASAYENISLTDSDVLFDWDDIFNSQRMCYQSSLNIFAMHGTKINNITFDNIRLHKSMRVACVGFSDDFYFGCLKSSQADPGEISNVTFRNITSTGDTGWPNTDEIRMLVWHGDGGTPTKAIHDITFDNVVLNGRPLERFDDLRIIANDNLGSKLLYNINFNNSTENTTGK